MHAQLPAKPLWARTLAKEKAKEKTWKKQIKTFRKSGFEGVWGGPGRVLGGSGGSLDGLESDMRQEGGSESPWSRQRAVPEAAESRPRTPQRRPRAPKSRPRDAQDPSKEAPEASKAEKSEPEGAQKRLWERF